MNEQIQQAPQNNIKIYYQMSTTNKSFLDMHYYLKSIGVKNNRFFLQLLDPMLAGVDPHDEALSREMKSRIARECLYNYWYYVREVVRIPTDGQSRGSKFNLTRATLATYFLQLQSINTYLEIPRQQGKTVGAAVFYSWIYNFGSSNCDIRILHQKLVYAQDNLGKIKDIIDMLPPYLQMNQEYSQIGDKKKKKISNVQSMKNAMNNNSIKVTASARSRTSAASLLRGKTITFWWCDEWAFIPYNDIIYVNTYPALRTAFNNARANGKPYGILFTSTPGFLTTDEGVHAFKMHEDCTVFSETWYDKPTQTIKAIVNSNIRSDCVLVRYHYNQLGRDETWLEEICKGMGWKMPDIRREVLLEWANIPENCPFSSEDLEDIDKSVREPINTIELLGQYILKVYKFIPLNNNYIPKYPPIIGVDVSGGYRRDSSGITVIDSLTTETIATFKSNTISPINLARLIIEIVVKLYPNAIVNVERNGGYGASVIAKLKESAIKSNLYFEIKDKVVEEQSDGIRIKKRSVMTKVFGLDSSKDIRDLLMEILRERVENHKEKFVSKDIVDEMRQMEVKRSGKIEHSSNSHDDLVFSYLMALYVWYEGKNLKENYNIEKRTIKVDSGIDDTITSLDNQKVSPLAKVDLESSTKEDLSGTRAEIEQALAQLHQASGILYGEFVKQREAKEYEELRNLMRNPRVLEAYATQNNRSVEDVNDEFFNNGDVEIPASVFTNFNTDYEDSVKTTLAKNFNMGMTNRNDSQLL